VNTVQVLVTYDIHITTHPVDEVRRCLESVIRFHDRLGIPSTLFFPAEAAQLLHTTVRDLIAHHHEIGNHGLTHRDGEVYDLLTADVQERFLRQATKNLEDVMRRPVRCFRAPAFRLSRHTYPILDALGYDADVSMNSQRLGLLSSDLWNFSWMVAPRQPYYPHHRHPWRRGNLNLLSIPVSCALLPYISNTMLIFGLPFMKGFFRSLYHEARLTGKPVVFMTHPEDLHSDRPAVPRNSKRWKDLLPTKYGFEFRHWLMENDPQTIAQNNQELLAHMRSFPHTEFLTVSDYVNRLRAAKIGEPSQQVPIRPRLAPTHAPG
jgi:hypothetical protein